MYPVNSLPGSSCVTKTDAQRRDVSPALTQLVLGTLCAEIQSKLTEILTIAASSDAAASCDAAPVELAGRLDDIRNRSQALLGMVRESRAYPGPAATGSRAARDFACQDIVRNAIQLGSAAASDFGCEVSYAVEPGVPQKLLGECDYLREMLICLIRDAVRVRRARRIHLNIQPVLTAGGPDRLLFRLALDEVSGEPPPLRVDIGSLTAGTQLSWAGLDLPVAAEFARLVGGELRCGRADGLYVLSVEVPVQASALKDGTREPNLERSEPRILLAEDNLINQRFGKLALERAGYKIEVASDGAEAVAAHGKMPYDIILMDCQMPELDGFEATAAIRALPGPQPLIVAVTAYARAGERERCLEAGMDDYLPKPFRAEQLIALVQRGAMLRSQRRVPHQAAGVGHSQSA
jgi:CheY-like chemotaxis protein